MASFYDDRPREWYRYVPGDSSFQANHGRGLFPRWRSGSISTERFDELTAAGYGTDALELKPQYRDRDALTGLEKAHYGTSAGFGPPTAGDEMDPTDQQDPNAGRPEKPDCPQGQTPERIKVAGGFAYVCRDEDRPRKVLSGGYTYNGQPLSALAPEQVDDVVGVGAGEIGVPESYAEQHGVEESDSNNWTLLSKILNRTESSTRSVTVTEAIEIAKQRGLSGKLATLQSLQRGQGAVIQVSDSSLTIPGDAAQKQVAPPTDSSGSSSDGGLGSSDDQQSQQDSPARPSSGSDDDTADGSGPSSTDDSGSDGLSKRAVLAGLGAGAVLYGVTRQ